MPGARPQLARAQPVAARLAVDDRLAVGRERGLEVVARLRRQHSAFAARCGDDANRPQRLVVEAGVDDPLAVAREGGEGLQVVFLSRQPPRLARGQGPDPEPAQRLEDDRLAVGRHLDAAQHRRAKGVGGDRDREAQRLRHLARRLHAEGNRRHGARFSVHPAELAARPDDDRASRRASRPSPGRRRGSPRSPAGRGRGRARARARHPRRGPARRASTGSARGGRRRAACRRARASAGWTPPGPVTQSTISPVSRSRRRMT